MKDLLEIHDNKLGSRQLDELKKGKLDVSKAGVVSQPISSIPSSYHQISHVVTAQSNGSNPAPYGVITSPGCGISAVNTVSGQHNSMASILTRQNQISPLINGNFPQPLVPSVNIPYSSPSTSCNNIASSHTSPAAHLTSNGVVSGNLIGSSVTKGSISQLSPSNPSRSAGPIQTKGIPSTAAAAVPSSNLPGKPDAGSCERLTLTQELAKIQDFNLFTMNQVAGQNTRWSLYMFDVRKEIRSSLTHLSVFI